MSPPLARQAAQTKHPSVPMNSDRQNSCNLEDSSTENEALEQKPTLKACLMAEDTSQQVIPLSDRSQSYRVWLLGLQNIASSLSSIHAKNEGIIHERNRLSELLKLVIAELEHKVALDEFKSHISELGFWDSVQEMAKTCEFDFSDFVKTCCSPEFNGLQCPVDSSIPGLVDHGHETPWSFGPEKRAELAQDPIPFPLTHESGACALSGLPSYAPPNFPDMSSIEVFQQFPLDPARGHDHSTPSPMKFGHSTFPDFQSNLLPSLGFDSFGQGHLYPPVSHYTASSMQRTKLDNFMVHQGKTIIPTACGIPSKNEISQSLAGCLNTMDPSFRLPTAVPGTCKRRIQRQRRRLMSYDHLVANFDASASSLTWSSVRPSKSLMSASCSTQISEEHANITDKNRTLETDLQFLLQKELKPSDVGSLGRIILPKRQAEEKLPHLDAKEGLTLSFEDLQTSQIWNLRFRFWPNNKTRMYLLESTGNFVRSHHLQEGDYIVLYRNRATGKFMINGRKVVPSKAMEKNEQQNIPSSNEVSESARPSFELVSTTTVHEKSTQVKEAVDEMNPDVVVRSTSTIKITEGSYLGDMEDPDDLIKGFSTFEADERSIDEIFDFK